ncbi:unnamed protein product [Trichogramma brassicae]|uniref:Cadherin domain-containing protein n=1 Tax=Trichogramma brassicae TaxID=86971 RepID=A0A6H5I3M8_9HYME|nr:unnamed protein product [Trichogramma brassicae]
MGLPIASIYIRAGHHERQQDLLQVLVAVSLSRWSDAISVQVSRARGWGSQAAAAAAAAATATSARGSPAGLFFGSYMPVRVNVLDKNDVAPSWSAGGPWRYEVSEEAPPGTLIAQLRAEDPDSIGSVKYSIVEPPPAANGNNNGGSGNSQDNLLLEVGTSSSSSRSSSPFKLDAGTGQLRLVEALDREAKDTYVLRVRADDGLQHSDCQLTILRV